MSGELPTTAQIRAVAREVLTGLLGERGGGGGSGPREGRLLVNEALVLSAHQRASELDKEGKGVLTVPEDALVTPLARDAAERFSVEIRFSAAATGGTAVEKEKAGEPDAAPAPAASGGAIAFGADHGGFKLKEALRRHLEGQGLVVQDHGTTSEASCDYPDFAARVARAVSLGEAGWGVLVDGAGIGSAMAANKVPGVLAATCHDEKSAKNAREHNGANVLCLGSGFLDEGRARAVLDAFLATGFGGGRHGRRVAKIRALERAFLLRGAP